MSILKTTVRCPDKRFRTARYARNWAWRTEPDPRKRPVPVQCPDCTAWHLTSPTPPTNDPK